jgi:DNA-binding transcriptional LysR family regulator
MHALFASFRDLSSRERQRWSVQTTYGRPFDTADSLEIDCSRACNLIVQCMHSDGPMKRRNMTNIDLRLLTIVNELNKTRSVSQAAENLELSQSAVSMSLARLRKHFKDPLFVRTPDGMEPTPQMSELIELLEKAEGLLETALVHRITFNPSTSDRSLRLGATDITRVSMLPSLMQRLHATARGVGVELQDISEETPRLLHAGRLDLAVGYLPATGSGFCQQRLFKDRFVCAVRTNHSRIEHTVSLEQFENEPHVVLTMPGSGIEVVEKALEANRIHRKVRLRLPGCFGISSMITGADCLAVIPEQLGKLIANTGRIKLLPLPFALPPYYVMQHWHERYTHDPASKWLRSVIAELFREKGLSAGDADPALLHASNGQNHSE